MIVSQIAVAQMLDGILFPVKGVGETWEFSDLCGIRAVPPPPPFSLPSCSGTDSDEFVNSSPSIAAHLWDKRCVSRFRDLYRAVPIVLPEAQRHLHHITMPAFIDKIISG